ncbi:MAG: alpha-L-rhamnosidase [Tannerella sp.]|jgi:hypothetical protein|nr:alpha-L-rhamnosidase [Tannerella sp.]
MGIRTIIIVVSFITTSFSATYALTAEQQPLSRKGEPYGLLCNLLSHPELSVITERTPSFGWIVPENGQKAYRILVSSSAAAALKHDGDMWDSRKVKSSQSINISYSGVPLEKGKSYFWQVCVWDNSGKMSAFSEIQRFNTGDFDKQRRWKGESEWVQVRDDNDSLIWTFENRHPIAFHAKEPRMFSMTTARPEVIFFDFGKAAFANASFTVYSPEDKDITIRIGERAEEDTINRNPGGGVIYQEYPFHLKAGEHAYNLDIPRFKPHYPHSQAMPENMPEIIPFRYMEFVRDDPHVTIKDLKQHALYYLFNDSAASFHSSDSTLDAIYDLCRYSVKANTFNGDYAASQRERMMYEADCFSHQMSHYAVDREYAIARYSLENMIYHATWPTEWILHIPLMAWADYVQTGDKSVMERYYDDMKPKTLLALAGNNDLISTRTGLMTEEFCKSIYYNSKELRDIVDWPQQGGFGGVQGETDNYDFTTYNAVVNAFHYRALVLMGKMAELLRKKDDAKFYRERAAKVYKAFNSTFLNPSTGYYVDGENSAHSSLHANMFALCFGLVPDANRLAVIDLIKSRGMACGVYGAHFLLEALYDAGEADYALSLLTSRSDRSWYNMIRVGSTMTTEAWDTKYKTNNGWSHAWSASPAHIIPRKLMGIEPLEAGFGKIRIKPQPASLRQASALMPTIRGDVRASFDNRDDTFVLNVEIPANTTAEIWMPLISDKYKLTVDDAEKKGVKIDKYVKVSIKSGKHSLTIKKSSI